MADICSQHFQFLYPQFFWGVGILFAAFLFIFIGRKKRSIVFSGFDELKQIYQKDSWWYKLYVASILCSSVLFITLLARPTICHTEVSTEKNGIDIEILFDDSYSMMAEDLKPNRLEMAKKVFGDFIGELSSDRVGLIIFAGKPFVSAPLGFDYGFVSSFLSEISADTIEQNNYQLQGTAIGDAMIMGESAFQTDSKRQKVMILLTDGTANRGIDPLVALKFVKEKGIKVYTIGVGGTKPTTIIANDAFGNPQKIQVDGIDETSLKKIASETGGKYYLADSSDTLERIVKEIGSLEKTKIETKQHRINQDWYQPIILLLISFLTFVAYLRTRGMRL